MLKNRSSISFFVVILLMLLMMLAVSISYYPVPVVDLRLMHLMQTSGGTRTLFLMYLISTPGNLLPAVILGIIAFAVILVSPLRQAVIPLSLVMPADILSVLLKDAVSRPRPSVILVNVHQALSDYGFPSSHVVHYTVFFGFLAYYFWHAQYLPKVVRLSLITLCLGLVCTVSLSRIYLGAHWPTDVLGGYFLGLSILLVQIRVFQKLHPNKAGHEP